MKKMNTEKSVVYEIEGMTCPDCAETIRRSVLGLPEVTAVNLDYVASEMEIVAKADPPKPDKVLSLITKLGYRANPQDNGGTTRSTLIVKGMDCAEESRPIEDHLRKVDGISAIGFNLLENKLFVTHSIPLADVQQEVRAAGFESIAAAGEQITTDQRLSREQKKAKIILSISGIAAALGTGLSYLELSPWLFTPILTLAIAIGGFPIARKGYHEAIRLRLGINFLMTLAVIGAMIIGEWSEAAMVVFLFALANYLEARAMVRARQSIRSLMNLAPEYAQVKTRQVETTRLAETVKIGETIVIKPGERIPLDGTVSEGNSRVNQAPITGESMSVKKGVGDEVFAGTINELGSLLVEVTRVYRDSTIYRINKLVEEAQSKKAPAQSFVEKFSSVYTPAVVILATAIAIVPPVFLGADFSSWFYRALVLLVISCPCALVISTPVAIVSGLTNAARHGILIKGGAYLEAFGKLKALAMDKTGTVTEGRSKLVKIIGHNGHGESEILALAASAESRSEHPLAQAILEAAKHQAIPLKTVQRFKALPGKGLRAWIDDREIILGNHALFEELNICDSAIHAELEKIENASHTAVLIGDSKSLFGILSIADSIRPQAEEAIRALRQSGIKKLVMLSGDNHRTAAAIAKEIGIDDSHAELLPAEKVAAIEALRKNYEPIAMVGDGINDAPALAAATVGISMGSSGTNAALETADVALMRDDLSKLPYLRRLGRYTLNNIKQNIALALGFKAVFLILAIPGLATLWMAVVADMGASLLVVFNGLRVLRYQD